MYYIERFRAELRPQAVSSVRTGLILLLGGRKYGVLRAYFRRWHAPPDRGGALPKGCQLCCRVLSSVGLSNTAYLAGLMHDTGKLTQEYQTYLERAARGEAVRRGSVVHTFAGVRFLLEHYHGSKHDSSFNDITCELLSRD